MRYRWALVVLALDLLLWFWDRGLGLLIAKQSAAGFGEMLLVVPPIFILIGLMDVWVPKEQVMAHVGQGTGLKGLLLSVLLGAASAGPLYGAFPIAGVMLKKGAGFFNVMVFLGSWATLKLPMFLFEFQYLGHAFAVARWVCSLAGILAIAFLLDRFVPAYEKEDIYAKHRNGAV